MTRSLDNEAGSRKLKARSFEWFPVGLILLMAVLVPSAALASSESRWLEIRGSVHGEYFEEVLGFQSFPAQTYDGSLEGLFYVTPIDAYRVSIVGSYRYHVSPLCYWDISPFAPDTRLLYQPCPTEVTASVELTAFVKNDRQGRRHLIHPTGIVRTTKPLYIGFLQTESEKTFPTIVLEPASGATASWSMEDPDSSANTVSSFDMEFEGDWSVAIDLGR